MLDYFKGHRIKKDLIEIRETLSCSSFEALKANNKENLRKFLEYCTEHSEYYSRYKGFNSLEDFPVVNKNVIKEHLDLITISSKQYRKVSTSGSTGIPFSIYQSKRKKYRNTADTIYFAGLSGYTLGERLLYLRSWSKHLKKSRFLYKIQNITPVDVNDLSDHSLGKFISDISRDRSPKAWLGYPSGFKRICDYLEKIESKPLDCNITSVIGMSEGFGDSVKLQMEYFFKKTPVSRYSNMENGIIAQQMAGNKFFTINWASYYIEILDLHEDIPVPYGEIGRIVITDLYNTATPMIRYDTGDIGVMCLSNDPENQLPMLQSVHGRMSDVLYNTKGEMINPFKFHGLICQYPEVGQIQFIQKGKRRYLIKLNNKNNFVREQEFINSVYNCVGKDAIVQIQYVNEIPLLKSGKRKVTINLVA